MEVVLVINLIWKVIFHTNKIKCHVERLYASLNSIKPEHRKIKSNSQRVRNIYNPLSIELFKISRSKLELFIRCNRCFYIDRRLGVGYPDMLSFSLNLAVDELLKKEFDIYRENQTVHPLCLENNINFIPFQHVNLASWRKSLHEGIQYVVPETNIMLHGGVDDVWINPETNELIIVDYKATSKKGEVDLDADWQITYKRQAEIYQWLFRKNGFQVSSIAYFVYCNAKKDVLNFNKELQFKVSLIPYNGDDSWVESVVMQAYECLQLNVIPIANESCEYCEYWQAVRSHVDNK